LGDIGIAAIDSMSTLDNRIASLTWSSTSSSASTSRENLRSELAYEQSFNDDSWNTMLETNVKEGKEAKIYHDQWLLRRQKAREDYLNKMTNGTTSTSTTKGDMKSDGKQEGSEHDGEATLEQKLDWNFDSEPRAAPQWKESIAWLPPSMLLPLCNDDIHPVTTTTTTEGKGGSCGSREGSEEEDEIKLGRPIPYRGEYGTGDIPSLPSPLSTLLIPLTTSLHRQSLISFGGEPFSSLPSPLIAIIADYVMILTWEERYKEWNILNTRLVMPRRC
jgi:hypothetical protein